MSRLLGFLRARYACARMVPAGLLERDGTRYVLTGKGRAFASLRDALDTGWRS